MAGVVAGIALGASLLAGATTVTQVTPNVAALLAEVNMTTGAATVTIQYTTPAGRGIMNRTLIIPADRSKPIKDNLGNTVSATVPSTLGTRITNFQADIASMISAAAGAGKLDF